ALAAHQRIELTFQRGLRQVAAELGEQRGFLRASGWSFFAGAAGQFFAQRRQTQSALLQDFRAKALLFAQDSEQQVFGADVPVPQALGLFRGEIQDAFGFLAERHFDRRGDALANGDALFDLFADGLDGAVRTQETIGQRLVLAHQAEQQVLSLDVRRAILAGFVARKKYDASCLLCVAFKHGSTRFSLSPKPRALVYVSTGRSIPCSSCSTRSARPARTVLCVAKIEVSRYSRCSRCISSKTAIAFRSSRSPVGSSASSKAGCCTSARAIATRCCSPPDNSPARCLTRAPRPTSLSQRSEVSSASPFFAPRISRGIATFSAAVKSANR